MKVGFDSVNEQQARLPTDTSAPAHAILGADFRLSKKVFEDPIVEFSHVRV